MMDDLNLNELAEPLKLSKSGVVRFYYDKDRAPVTFSINPLAQRFGIENLPKIAALIYLYYENYQRLYGDE